MINSTNKEAWKKTLEDGLAKQLDADTPLSDLIEEELRSRVAANESLLDVHNSMINDHKDVQQHRKNVEEYFSHVAEHNERQSKALETIAEELRLGNK